MGSSQIHALRMLMNIILITAIIILFIYTYYIYLYILCFSVQMSRGVPDMSLVVGPQLVAHYDAHETIDLNKRSSTSSNTSSVYIGQKLPWDVFPRV